MAATKIVEKKESLVTGLGDSHITFIKSTELPVQYETETIKSPNLKSYKQTITNESTDITGSNKLYDVVPGNNKFEVAISTVATPAEAQAKMLGRYYEKIAEIGYVGAVGEEANPVPFAFTTEMPKRNGGVVFICYPYLMMSKELEKEFKEMGSGYEESLDEYSFKALSADSEGKPFVYASIEKDYVEALRATWHQNPPRSQVEAKGLVDALTSSQEG